MDNNNLAGGKWLIATIEDKNEPDAPNNWGRPTGGCKTQNPVIYWPGAARRVAATVYNKYWEKLAVVLSTWPLSTSNRIHNAKLVWLLNF